MSHYVGRFAPTPSGELHLGSLVTALGSWLDARASGGRWLLRIDDLDRPRVRPGAESAILRQLEGHGLVWDGPLRRQSEHVAEYEAALETLRRRGRVYACRCTRAQLAALCDPTREDVELPYPGTCREAGYGEQDSALRIRVGEAAMDTCGDFVVRRRDGQLAYQLACAVDETAQGITDVVRGADLVLSGRRQAHLLRELGQPVPRYRYLPVILDEAGSKLSKRNEAQPLEASTTTHNLLRALALLGQPQPPRADSATPVELLDSARRLWRPERIPEGPLK